MSDSVNTLSTDILFSQPIEVSNHEFLESIFVKHPNLLEPFAALCTCLLFSLLPVLVVLIGMVFRGME